MNQLSFDFTTKPKLHTMYLSLNSAKDLIHKSTKSTIEATYKECWRSIAPTEKVKLEKWWLNNKDSLPQFREDCFKDYGLPINNQ
jgi:hypothetical protein